MLSLSIHLVSIFSMILSRTLFLLAFLPFLAVGIASAQEAGVEAEASVEATIETQGPRPMPLKPLDALRRARELQQGINMDARDAREDWRAETRAELQGAEPGERPGIMREAMPERMQIAKNRVASTTALRMKMRAAVQKHAGLIRERFTNAITHLEKFMTRIDSRIEKLSSEGVDVSAVVALQTDAESAIASAKTDTEAVRTYMASVTDESDRDAVKSEIGPLVKAAQESIKEAHATVKAVVKALVDLSKANKPASVEVEADTSASAEIE